MTPHPSTLRPLALIPLLTALLGGCGGGSDSTTPPTPTGQVRVQFTSPTDTDNVRTVGAAIPVAVGVTFNGAIAADGSSVLWSAANASFSPARSSSTGGQASSTMVATAGGMLQVQASATVAGQTGSATQTLYLRPAPQALEVLVPAYFNPNPSGSAWDQLISTAQAYPGVQVTAIMNPNDGIFSSADEQFARVVSDFTGEGGQVVAYVATGYGTGRSVSAIKQNIDNYLRFYGRNQLSGFFLDEMGATSQHLAFYKEIYSYIKGLDEELRVIGNPGTLPVADYAAVADVLVTFEGKASDYTRFNPQDGNAWVYAKPNAAQAMLVHNATSCTAMQTAMRAAASARNNTGLVYATDLLYDFATNTGNPWANLPSYWTSLLGTVSALNRGTALPGC